MNNLFRKFAARVSSIAGNSKTFIFAVLIILLWATSGPRFGFSDTWQLVINTSTTIVTFLMVFIIQNTQNRDARAIHIKLDELIKGNKGARNQMVDAEDLSDDELETLHLEFRRLHEHYTNEMIKRGKHPSKPPVHKPVHVPPPQSDKQEQLA